MVRYCPLKLGPITQAGIHPESPLFDKYRECDGQSCMLYVIHQRLNVVTKAVEFEQEGCVLAIGGNK